MKLIQYRASAGAACTLLVLSVACGGKDDSAASAPARQIELAPAAPAQAQLADAPIPAAPTKSPAKTPAKAPATNRPAPVPEPPPAARTEAPSPAPAAVAAPAPSGPAARATGTIASGTAMTLKPATRICTSTHRAGDRFTATLAQAIQGSNGAQIPAGAVAVLRIVDAPKNVSSKDSVRLAYDILSVRVGDETYEVNAHVTQSSPLERVNTQSTGDKAKKIGAGAAIGAIAGRILGGNTKSTVIGGAVGAAAGAAVAAGSETFNGCLRDDGTITLVLDRPLTISLAPKF